MSSITSSALENNSLPRQELAAANQPRIQADLEARVEAIHQAYFDDAVSGVESDE